MAIETSVPSTLRCSISRTAGECSPQSAQLIMQSTENQLNRKISRVLNPNGKHNIAHIRSKSNQMEIVFIVYIRVFRKAMTIIEMIWIDEQDIARQTFYVTLLRVRRSRALHTRYEQKHFEFNAPQRIRNHNMAVNPKRTHLTTPLYITIFNSIHDELCSCVCVRARTRWYIWDMQTYLIA